MSGTSGLAGPKARKSVIPRCVGAEKRPYRTPETARTAGRSEGPGAGKRPGFLPAFFRPRVPRLNRPGTGINCPGGAGFRLAWEKGTQGLAAGHTGRPRAFTSAAPARGHPSRPDTDCGAPPGPSRSALCSSRPSECAARCAPPRSAGSGTPPPHRRRRCRPR